MHVLCGRDFDEVLKNIAYNINCGTREKIHKHIHKIFTREKLILSINQQHPSAIMFNTLFDWVSNRKPILE